jgi:hypothetical protein
MKILPEHIKALRAFGYTDSEARFLYIVATHSGYFIPRHFAEFSGNKAGRAIHTFTTRILAHGHAKQRRHQNNARVYHLTHRRIYQSLDKENIRNRRTHSFEFIKTRLAILDFILSHLHYDYFEGEFDKVQYFQERFELRLQEIPGRAYSGANQVPDTIRYFVDKFPLYLDLTMPAQPLVTLTYIDPGFGNLSAFTTHLRAYSVFLSRLPRFAFLFASPDVQLFPKAQRLFAQEINPRPGEISVRLARYFRLRSVWEAKRYEVLSNDDLEFLNHARQCFSGELFESTYQKWQTGTVAESALVAHLDGRSERKQKITFNTCLLPHDYSLFGQNSQLSGKPH